MGSTEQTKTGNLIIEGNLITDGFKMLAGAGANKVLTTDASGIASWQTPAGGSLWTQTGDDIYYNTGNVGIGTTNPASTLDVKGSFSVGVLTSFSSTGGTITYTDSNGLNPRSSPAYSDGYTVHTFTSNGTFTSNSAGDIEVLVVAGGGSGSRHSAGGGGGGGGGVIHNVAFAVTAQEYSVIVGEGGAGSDYDGNTGEDSYFGNIKAFGGGLASRTTGVNRDGGSGGGTAHNSAGLTGGATIQTSNNGGFGYGNNGGNFIYSPPYNCGSGGGAGAAGGIGAAGGAGKEFSISGVPVTYAGGGGTCGYYGPATTGGAGGGGDGEVDVNGESGEANTGGGGGGTCGGTLSGAGGSGIVIVRYPATPTSLYVNTSGNVGIGTTIPSEKLEVTGNIKISGKGLVVTYPIKVKQTLVTHNGLFSGTGNGYAAMQSWIQTNGCAGYHVCNAWELTYAFANLSVADLCRTDGNCYGWFWLPLYTETPGDACSCLGWRTDSSTVSGNYWYGMFPYHLTCNALLPVLCCQ